MAVDERDNFGSVLAERDKIRDDLETTRDRLREADAEAKKVPSLQAELARSQRDLQQEKEVTALQKAQLGDKDAEIKRLSSELREQAELESETQKAKDKAVEAVEERDKAQSALASARAHNEALEGAIASRDADIRYLKQHEEHTHKFAEVVGLTQKLVS